MLMCYLVCVCDDPADVRVRSRPWRLMCALPSFLPLSPHFLPVIRTRGPLAHVTHHHDHQSEQRVCVIVVSGASGRVSPTR